MASAVRRLAAELPVEPRLIAAPSLDQAEVAAALRAAGLDAPVVREDRFAAIADAHLALCASGTATLETGLLGTPMVVVYRLTGATYRLAQRLVKLPFFSLVNLVLERAVVPELLQPDAGGASIAAAAGQLLRDRRAVTRMRQSLAGLRERLGPSGASERAADEVAAVLAAAGAR
jgi:lipid-A-disaccharide synthase